MRAKAILPAAALALLAPASASAVSVTPPATPPATPPVSIELPVTVPIQVPVSIPPTIPTGACAGSELPAAQLDDDAYRQGILCLLNDQRSRAKRGQLGSDGRLRRAAQRHSAAMVSEGFFAHAAPGARGIVRRVRATGYLRGAVRWYVGENLAWAYGRLSSPAKVVEGWMESPPHRHNLLRGGFDEVGIGIVRGTPTGAGESSGVTVTTDYGFRD